MIPTVEIIRDGDRPAFVAVVVRTRGGGGWMLVDMNSQHVDGGTCDHGKSATGAELAMRAARRAARRRLAEKRLPLGKE